MEQILPKLDTNVLITKANEAAMKGAISTIEEYYTGYGSPYRKAIDEELKKQEFSWPINLPDVMGLINDSLTKEIDLIANTAVSKSFLPMVSRFLIREKKLIDLSDILKEFVEIIESKDEDDYSVSIKETKSYGWLDVEITGKDLTYRFTLHTSGPKGSDLYNILSLPLTDSYDKRTMKLSIDGATLEMPFTGDVLKDPFISFLARLIIAKTNISMDCKDFHQDMFNDEE